MLLYTITIHICFIIHNHHKYYYYYYYNYFNRVQLQSQSSMIMSMIMFHSYNDSVFFSLLLVDEELFFNQCYKLKLSKVYIWYIHIS